ncbi:hypothetical protein [Streptomyces kanamyceticus]|uniref:SH3 domain-containing protein n=1 Tax=Streptomyces kanamyceticus TaxID=1967 RepID=A0A5J6GEJ6_STRKN|nr:hypothetical protein [Streptomyces kanamyceticus]QEU91626.1 hypothetical protein CP970_12710 [Streptomyces kanamyceticus]
MKFRLMAPAVAFSALALVGTTVATSGTAVAASKPDCSRQIVNVPAKETVKVRASKKLGATAYSQWNKGKKGSLCNDGHFYKGQKYKLCGKTSTQWLYGSQFGAKRGWIPAACIKWS